MSDERDEARLKMRAEANFERNLRYKDSRLRTIGLPTQALAQQVAEKKFAKQKEVEEGKAERSRNAEIDVILEKVATDEEALRRQKAAQMRAEWNAQIQEKEFLRKQGRQSEIDSFQNDTPMEFAGDDPLHDERVTQQRDQIRRWTDEDLEEREWRRQRERDEDMAQAQLNLTIDEMRLQQQVEEDRLKKEVTRKILSENTEVNEGALGMRWQHQYTHTHTQHSHTHTSVHIYRHSLTHLKQKQPTLAFLLSNYPRCISCLLHSLTHSLTRAFICSWELSKPAYRRKNSVEVLGIATAPSSWARMPSRMSLAR
jgi:hypothetical protein